MNLSGTTTPECLYTLQPLSAEDIPSLLKWMRNETYSTLITFITGLGDAAKAYTARSEANQAFALFFYFNHRMNTFDIPKRLIDNDFVVQLAVDPSVVSCNNLLYQLAEKCVSIVRGNEKVMRLFWEINPKEQALLEVAAKLGFKRIRKKKLSFILELEIEAAV